MKKILGILLIIALPSVLQGQIPQKLQDSLQAMCRNLPGEAGIYVKDLRTGDTFGINKDVIFPTASIIKIPILVGVMDKVHSQELAYHQPLMYKDSLYYAGEDILGSFKDGDTIALDKVIMLMLTMSDNTASLWLQQLAGTGVHINAKMSDLGLEHTRVNSRTPGRRSDWEQYGWGQTTPKEFVILMEKLWKGEVIDQAASERMLRNLKRNYWDTEALMMLPPYVNTFSKNGAVSQSRSEVVLVNGRNSDYIFAVMTKDLEDTTWDYDNAGWQLIRNVSQLLWNYFEPQDPWQSSLESTTIYR
jgi:beta-lactamase class A